MFEGLFPALGASVVVRCGWRTCLIGVLIVAAYFGCEMFAPVLGFIASAFLMPIFFLLPISIYWGYAIKMHGSGVIKSKILAAVLHLVIFTCARYVFLFELLYKKL